MIRNIPPVGDNEWHLYDIVTDPGETKDLKAGMPERYQAMFADYQQWAVDNGVLPMPDDYDPIQQVQINAFVNVFMVPVVGFLALLVISGVFVIANLRRRGAN